MFKKLTLVFSLVLVLNAGCVGPYNAFNSLSSWNQRATESKVLNELIFLGLNFIPVYPIFMLGDALIFNSFEWWGAENPISEPQSFTDQGDLSAF